MAEQKSDAENAPEAAEGGDEISRLMSQPIGSHFGASVKDEAVRKEIEDAVAILARKAAETGESVSEDSVRFARELIAEIDKKMSDQINEILHHEEFLQLEGAWRGLGHLVMNTATDETCKIKVLPITKKELHKSLTGRYEGAKWDTSPIFKKIYGEGLDRYNAEPFGCLIGDYYFDHSMPDVKLLQQMSQNAAAAHAPFIAAAGPSLLGMDDWAELPNPENLDALMNLPDHASWQSLRKSEDSRYIGLTMPRFLARAPYGNQNPVEEFGFEEDTGGSDTSKFCWANAAYAMGVNVNRAFKKYGWCVKIRDLEGGLVEGLPVHTFPTDDGGMDSTCPTEVAVGQRRQGELERNGLIPLCHHQNTDYAVFNSAQSVQAPAVYDDADATANAQLSARLPYMFAVSRFAHYLKSMATDWRGKFSSREQLERELDKWIKQYVLPSPHLHSEDDKARKPLQDAKVTVSPVEGNPGYYEATFHLMPHFQLEGLKASLRLVSKIPSGAK